MICKYCNKTIPENSLFCPACGQKVDAEPTENHDAPPVDSTDDAPVTPAAEYTYGTNQPPFATPAPKRKKNGLKIVLAGIALLLVAALIVGFATNWLGYTGPMAQIARATKRIFAANNFTVNFDIHSDGDRIKGSASLSIDLEARELIFYAKAKVNDEMQVLAIYDEYIFVRSGGIYQNCRDISDELDEFFDRYEEVTKKSSKKTSWEDIIDNDDVYEELEDHIDFDALNRCFSAYAKKLNNTGWLKENAGYSVKRDNGMKVHSFDTNVYTFLKASLPIFEKVFTDDDDYEDVEDELSSAKSTLKHVDFALAFGIERGKLVNIEITASNSDLRQFDLEFEFSDIGETGFDTDVLDDMLADAKHANKFGLVVD